MNFTATAHPLNNAFLLSLQNKTCNMILDNIANHYGITRKEAMDEVLDEDAENIMDYITGDIRAAAHVFYQRFLLSYRK